MKYYETPGFTTGVFGQLQAEPTGSIFMERTDSEATTLSASTNMTDDSGYYSFASNGSEYPEGGAPNAYFDATGCGDSGPQQHLNAFSGAEYTQSHMYSVANEYYALSSGASLSSGAPLSSGGQYPQEAIPRFTNQAQSDWLAPVSEHNSGTMANQAVPEIPGNDGVGVVFPEAAYGLINDGTEVTFVENTAGVAQPYHHFNESFHTNQYQP